MLFGNRLRLAALASGLLAGVVPLAAPVAATPVSSAVRMADPLVGKPNVVSIVTDDMRADDLQFMPNTVSLLQQQGATFTQFRTNLSWCCPSDVTSFNGQYAHNHGVFTVTWANHQGGYRGFNESTSFVNLLPDYNHALVGKYLNEYGKESTDYLHVPSGYTDWFACLGGGCYNQQSNVSDNGVKRLLKTKPLGVMLGDKAVELVRKYSLSDKPFTMRFRHATPHVGKPVDPDDSLMDSLGIGSPSPEAKYRDTYTGPTTQGYPTFNEPDTTRLKQPGFIRSRAAFTANDIAAIKELNAQRRESLRTFDDQVGRIVAELAATGELDNTYVLFTSDNGYMLGEHRIKEGKNVAFEEANRLPFIVRGPGIAPGSAVHDIVGNQDIMPTIMDVADVPLPVDAAGNVTVDGQSVLPIIGGNNPHPNRSHLLESRYVSSGKPYTGVVMPDGWKYIDYRNADGTDYTGGDALYNVFTDPYEQYNLVKSTDAAATAARSAAIAKLQQLKDCKGTACLN